MSCKREFAGEGETGHNIKQNKYIEKIGRYDLQLYAGGGKYVNQYILYLPIYTFTREKIRIIKLALETSSGKVERRLSDVLGSGPMTTAQI